MKAIRDAWKTLTDTLSVIGQYRSYDLYPLLSFIITLLTIFTVMIPLFDRVLEIAEADVPTQIFWFLQIYFMFGVVYFVTTFFNVALVTSLASHLDGDELPLSKGISTAFQRVGPIVIYSLVSTILNLVSSLAKKLFNPFFGGVIAPLIGKRLWLRWRQLSHNIPLLMAVPVMALDHSVPDNNIFKRGEQLVKETWGERVKPSHSIGLLALLVLLPIVLLVAAPALEQGVAERNIGLIRVGSSVLLVSILTFRQVSALVNAIFGLAAYRHGTAGKSDLFPGDPSYAEHAFVKPKKETGESAALTASISGSPSVTAGDLSN
jgi:hypothetical protein